MSTLLCPCLFLFDNYRCIKTCFYVVCTKVFLILYPIPQQRLIMWFCGCFDRHKKLKRWKLLPEGKKTWNMNLCFPINENKKLGGNSCCCHIFCCLSNTNLNTSYSLMNLPFVWISNAKNAYAVYLCITKGYGLVCLCSALRGTWSNAQPWLEVLEKFHWTSRSKLRFNAPQSKAECEPGLAVHKVIPPVIITIAMKSVCVLSSCMF